VIERLRDELATFIRRVTGRLDYQALYPGTVRAQDGSGRLDIELDAPTTMPPLSGVPIRHGLPGVTVRVAAGARVMVTWERGDPSRPVATLWEPGSVVDIVVNGGTRHAARDGDSVSVEIPTGAVLVSSPGGPTPNPAPLTLTGTVTNGTSVLKLP
jgi:hypothetical protein